MRLLEKAGHRVTEAENGVEALKLVPTGQFDLVTVDMVMDKMDGVDTIVALRNEVSCPVVAISAHLTDELCKELEKLGVSGFLQKPFTIQEAQDLVDSIIVQPDLYQIIRTTTQSIDGSNWSSGTQVRSGREATNMQASATSSGWSAFSIISGGVGVGRFKTRGVSHKPGKMIDVRIPFSRSSTKVPCASPVIPCLLAW